MAVLLHFVMAAAILATGAFCSRIQTFGRDAEASRPSGS
ncbi:MAG: entericidin [Brevundimonas sp.]|nr:MAG: entericidin [Brevundimonas sp.]